jgi:hypothetical protein
MLVVIAALGIAMSACRSGSHSTQRSSFSISTIDTPIELAEASSDNSGLQI